MTILNEESRNNLIAKSKNSVKGLERYKKRVKSRVASSTQEFNQIDMNKLFKDNILEVSIKVNGETDNYLVKISFGGILDSINKELNRTGELDLRSIIRGIINTFNSLRKCCLKPSVRVPLFLRLNNRICRFRLTHRTLVSALSIYCRSLPRIPPRLPLFLTAPRHNRLAVRTDNSFCRPLLARACRSVCTY